VTDAAPEVAHPASAWAPLQYPVFRAVWLASVASNIGTWMHDASAGWMMTSLSPSPLMVALMQTATSLPFFLLAVPAGALADVVDRRRILIAAQTVMMLAAAALGLLTLAHLTAPWVLLGVTFVLGIGGAMTAPAWQAITPELVPRPELPAAIALGGMAVNVARAVGPALGGLLVAAVGPGWVFLLNAGSFLTILGVLALRYRSEPDGEPLGEDVLGAMRAGVRYVRYASPFRTVLIRSSAFILPASGLWALLPIVARHTLGLDAVGYGALLGCLGVGAIAAAIALPRLRRMVPLERLLVAATLGFAASAVFLGGVRVVPLVAVALVGGGFAWLTTMSSITTAAQQAVPGWVRARALAVSLLVIQGGLAFGSLLWGTVATHASVPVALFAAAATLVASLAITRTHPLTAVEGLDLRPTRHWQEPVLHAEPQPTDGPVLVTVDYHVEPGDEDAFAAAMADLCRVRRRDGAFEWRLFRDTADPVHWVETFLVDSWAEHMRQHHRVTQADRAVEDRAYAFNRGGRPVVRHLIAHREA